MPRPVLPALLLVLPLVALAQHPHTDPAVRCKAHPAYRSGLKPVLVSSWSYEFAANTAEQVAYLARYTGHVYAPVDDLSSRKYRGLDLFHTAAFPNAPNFRMHFQRPAKVYMLVDVADNKFDKNRAATLRKWKSEGWVQRVRGAATIEYGVHQTLERKMTKYAYVFSKTTGGKDFIDMPQTNFVKKKISGISVPGSFNILVAEIDGSASPNPGDYMGTAVRPNQRCPDKLHDAWMVPDDNRNDPDTRGIKFSSWHPQWDPCYWCAYDHEHGSAVEHLMGYKPKFTYTAWKNKRMNEADAGFKGFVFRNGDYLVYFNIHVTQSSLRRVGVRFHTINFVVVDRRSKELLMELHQKGDFGFESVLLKNGKFAPINADEQAIKDEQERNDEPENFRSVVVLDPKNPDPDFQFRRPNPIGQYETWQTLPMCAQPKNRLQLFETQFKLPIKGILAVDKTSTPTLLGRELNGKLYRSTGLNRSLRGSKMTFAQRLCPDNASGEFYTDVYGKQVLSGPGKNAVRQFIKPGFEMRIDDRYEPIDPWTGLHTNAGRGFFIDHGYGIDPDKN